MDYYGSLVENSGSGGSGGTVEVPIKTIKVNGVAQVPVNNTVDLTLPEQITISQADYDALVTAGTVKAGVEYFINDSGVVYKDGVKYGGAGGAVIFTDLTELKAKGLTTPCPIIDVLYYLSNWVGAILTHKTKNTEITDLPCEKGALFVCTTDDGYVSALNCTASTGEVYIGEVNATDIDAGINWVQVGVVGTKTEALTYAAYLALSSAGNVDQDTVYYCTDNYSIWYRGTRYGNMAMVTRDNLISDGASFPCTTKEFFDNVAYTGMNYYVQVFKRDITDLPTSMGILSVKVHPNGGSIDAQLYADGIRYEAVNLDDGSWVWKKVILEGDIEESIKYYDLGAWKGVEDLGDCDFSTLLYSIYNKTYNLNNPLVISGFVDEGMDTLYKSIRQDIFGSEIAQGYGVLTFKVDSIGMMEITYSLTHQTGVYMLTGNGARFTDWVRLDNVSNVITDIADLGLSYPQTTRAILNAMAVGDKAELNVTSSQLTNMPGHHQNGVLTINKISENWGNIQFQSEEEYFIAMVVGTDVHWYEFVYSDNLPIIYDDALSLTGDTTSTTMKNICYTLSTGETFAGSVTPSFVTDVPDSGFLIVRAYNLGYDIKLLTDNNVIYEGIWKSNTVTWHKVNGISKDVLVNWASCGTSVTKSIGDISGYESLRIEVRVSVTNATSTYVIVASQQFDTELLITAGSVNLICADLSGSTFSKGISYDSSTGDFVMGGISGVSGASAPIFRVTGIN